VSQLNAFSSQLLRSPLLWGTALAFAFFALVHGGLIADATVVRYLAGHWVEYVEVHLFCIGLAALAHKALAVVRERKAAERHPLEPIPEGGQSPAVARALADGLPAGPAASGSLVARLRDALDYVVRTGSADELEPHLKYLSELDAARAAQGYGLVRFVVWAIPIMGFLGTVIGITVAIASLSPTQLDDITGVVAGLGTAFDTTATALALSMVLMFLQFVIDRAEQRLIATVDDSAWRALAGRFQSLAGTDGAALAVARIGETMNRGSARLLEAQEQAWKGLERSAATGLRQVLDESADRLQAALGQSLEHAMSHWADSLARTQDELAARREQRWTVAAESLAAAVRGLETHQAVVAEQMSMLGGVVEATRDLATLERTLESNLGTLAATGRFEETLATLAAAVQLLAVRAGDATAEPRRVGLYTARSTGKAA
jgi:biopolymer transport protein ExbB/TolQ